MWNTQCVQPGVGVYKRLIIYTECYRSSMVYMHTSLCLSMLAVSLSHTHRGGGVGVDKDKPHSTHTSNMQRSGVATLGWLINLLVLGLGPGSWAKISVTLAVFNLYLHGARWHISRPRHHRCQTALLYRKNLVTVYRTRIQGIYSVLILLIEACLHSHMQYETE